MGDIKWDGPGYYMKDGDDWLKVCNEHALIWSYQNPVAYYESKGDYMYGIDYTAQELPRLVEMLTEKARASGVSYYRGSSGCNKEYDDTLILRNSIKVLIKEVLNEQ